MSSTENRIEQKNVPSNCRTTVGGLVLSVSVPVVPVRHRVVS